MSGIEIASIGSAAPGKVEGSMKIYRSLCLLALIGLSFSGHVSADTADDVRQAIQAWADAYNSHDPEKVAARYHPEAAFWGTTSPSLRTNPEDVAAYFASLGRRPNARVRIEASHLRIVDSIAIVTGSYTFSDRIDGTDVSRPSRFSFVLERSAGDWLIVQHHSSRMPE